MCVAWFSCDACFQRFTFTTDLIRRMGFVSRIFVLTSNNNQAGFLVLPKKKKNCKNWRNCETTESINLCLFALCSGTSCPNEPQPIQRNTARVPFSPGSERVSSLSCRKTAALVLRLGFIGARIFGDERPPAVAPPPVMMMSLDDNNVNEAPIIKSNRPRKARPPPKFDMAAELLMSGGREREVKLNNGGFITPDDVQDADRLLQRLKAL